ncbi:MAG: hypothetical protein ACR2MQ_04990, partial [Gemmatimonadaceae bacterium]
LHRRHGHHRPLQQHRSPLARLRHRPHHKQALLRPAMAAGLGLSRSLRFSRAQAPLRRVPRRRVDRRARVPVDRVGSVRAPAPCRRAPPLPHHLIVLLRRDRRARAVRVPRVTIVVRARLIALVVHVAAAA